MDLDVEQPAVLLLPDPGQPAHRASQELTVLDDAESAGTFGNQQAAVGKKRQPPRRLEISRENLHLESLLRRRDDLPVRIGHILRLLLQARRLCANVADELPDQRIVQRVLERRHSFFGISVPDALDERLVVAAVDPLVAEERRGDGTGRGADAVTGRADFGGTSPPRGRRVVRRESGVTMDSEEPGDSGTRDCGARGSGWRSRPRVARSRRRSPSLVS